MTTIIQKLCAVCKQGSHRTDWINKSVDGSKVACDFHTVEELSRVGINKVEPAAPAKQPGVATAAQPAASQPGAAGVGAATAKLAPAKPPAEPAKPVGGATTAVAKEPSIDKV